MTARATTRLAVGIALAVGCLGLAACGQSERRAEWAPFNGDPHRGAALIAQAGCGQCHIVPGVPDAVGTVGPSLAHFGVHTTVAGLLPNTPTALVRWIKEPQAVLPGNAMPDMHLSKQQAQDMAAYLHTLK
ncbi:MAG TPA: c-type cytochrome [Rhizomicrobium sp.]|nr:c-type cytochrome [Rhizomicrobium sp.]